VGDGAKNSVAREPDLPARRRPRVPATRHGWRCCFDCADPEPISVSRSAHGLLTSKHWQYSNAANTRQTARGSDVAGGNGRHPVDRAAPAGAVAPR
jgi:hypothetical protein